MKIVATSVCSDKRVQFEKALDGDMHVKEAA